jgi:zinc-ribbon domain
MPSCPKCGSTVEASAQFCPSCGASLAPTGSIPAMTTTGTFGGAVPPTRGTRPTGVTILAVLEILGGLALLAGGALLAVVGAIAGSGLIGGAGGILVILGLLSFVVTYGLWTGKGWAWRIALILSVVGIIFGAISIAEGLTGSVIGIIINLVVIYYLTRPYVRAYFGRSPTGSMFS